MKSTKVQNPRRIASRLVNYANARARKFATPRVVAVTREGPAASFWARLMLLGQAGYSPAVLQA